VAKDKASGGSGRGNGSGGKRRADQDRKGRGRAGGAASGGKSTRRSDDKDGKGRSSGRRGAPARRQTSAATSIAQSGSSQLPKWVREELIRVTPKTRAKSALEALEEAAAAFAAGQYHRAVRQAESAKKLSSRDATTREILALSAYRVGNWDLALRELRTYRRMTGDPVHLPVEMDVLRALDRPDEVHRSWEDLRRLGGPPASQKEGKVVYASFLLDRGDVARAWEVAKPGRLRDDPYEEDLRVWYVAARAAAHLGDEVTARRLLDAITVADPGFPGLTELDSTISEARRRK
jgi:predicted Zn-dependent protease